MKLYNTLKILTLQNHTFGTAFSNLFASLKPFAKIVFPAFLFTVHGGKTNSRLKNLVTQSLDQFNCVTIGEINLCTVS